MASKRTFEGSTEQEEKGSPTKRLKPEELASQLAIASASHIPQLQIRLLIDAKQAGIIIGKSGATVSKIRQDSGAFVEVQQGVNGAKKRIISIKGSASTCAAALIAINANFIAHKPSEEIPLVLLVGKLQVGNIIGKQGAKINSTRQETNASIKISETTLEQSDEKTLTIKGAKEAVDKAIGVVCLQLEECLDKTPRQLYSPSPDFSAFLATAAGSPAAAAAAAGVFNPGHQVYLLPVPEKLIGAVIGRGGTHINLVRAHSGAQIKIPHPDPASQERALRIEGTVQACEAAVAMIQHKLIVEGLVTCPPGSQLPAMPAMPPAATAASAASATAASAVSHPGTPMAGGTAIIYGRPGGF